MFYKVEKRRMSYVRSRAQRVVTSSSLYRTRRIVLGPQPNSPLIAHGHRNFPDGRRSKVVLGNIHFLTRSPASKADVTTKYYRLLIENMFVVVYVDQPILETKQPSLFVG